MFKEELSQSLEEVDTLEGKRSEIMQLAEQAIERALNHYANTIHSLFKDYYDPSGLIQEFKQQLVTWLLQGNPPGWWLLLNEKQQNDILSYAKNDFETESRGYIVDLEYQKRKLFWSEQG